MRETEIKDFEVQILEKRKEYSLEAADIKADLDIHIIPQSHLDLVWKWSMEDTEEMIFHTIQGHVEKLQQNSGYTFSQSQIFMYEYILNHFPALFDAVKELVRQGTWEVVGGEWVEPDHNLLDEESTVRQFLYGQKFVKKYFGKYVSTGWSPDTFGHHFNLPQVMRKSGIKFFVHKRPRQLHLDLPVGPYIWRGIDGSEILTLRANNKGDGLPGALHEDGYDYEGNAVAYVYRQNDKYGIRDLWAPLGVGDTGGVNDYEKVRTDVHPGLHMQYSTADRYYEKIKEKAGTLPVVERELNFIYQGCYTTHADMKKLHRLCEQKLEEAECLAAIVFRLGGEYPAQILTECWKLLLFSQFHDTITGTGIDRAYEQIIRQYQHILYSTEKLADKCLELLARNVDTASFERPYIIFNPASFPRAEILYINVTLSMPEEHFELQDGSGKCCDGVVVSDELIDGPGNYHRMKVMFRVEDIPALGYKIVGLVNRKAGRIPAAVEEMDDRKPESRFYRLELDENGGIASLFDKECGREWAGKAQQTAYPEILEEGNYRYYYGKPLKAWTLGFTGKKERLAYIGGKMIENNRKRRVVRQEFSYHDSKLQRDIILYQDEKRIDFEVKLDWYEVEKYLGVNFPLDMAPDAKTIQKIPFALAEREKTGEEMPALNYMILKDETSKFVLLTEDRYGFSVTPDNHVRMSLIRCSNDYHNFSDRGRYTFRYSIITAGEETVDSSLFRRAEGYKRPVAAKRIESSTGPMPAEYSFMHIACPDIVVSSVKKGEEEDALVIRLYNITDTEACTKIKLNLPEVKEVYLTDLLEDKQEKVMIKDKEIQLNFGKYEIKTLAIV